MISLRKSMEMQKEEILQAALKSYRDILAAIGEAGAKACPPAGGEFKDSLSNLQQRLNAEPSAHVITETKQLLEKELHTWSERTSRFYQDKTNDMKELLAVVAKAASQVGERDQRYAKQFGELADNLQATTKLNDLAAIRQSLIANVANLATCVTNMAKDSQESVAELQARVQAYETRLEEVERIASRDPLTGIANRRHVEDQLAMRLDQLYPFSVIYADLNGFKQINDTLGHAAGDDLLKQFAKELLSVFRTTDVVGRWGGDEFIILVDGDMSEARNRAERIDKWVNGEYTLATEGARHKVPVKAATGIASWRAGDTPTAILDRADAAMYEHKVKMKAAVER